jgi:hypothetical protein
VGRGLSDLQRFVLARAGERPRLYYAEVLVEWFGWTPGRPLKRNDAGTLHDPGGRNFSPAKIGPARYNQVMTTLSRVCASLRRRGLVTCLTGRLARWSAVEITDKGREWLSVNTSVPGA